MGGIEAAALVANLQAQRRPSVEDHPHLLGAGVLSGVGNGLGGDPQQRFPFLGPDTGTPIEIEIEGDLGPARTSHRGVGYGLIQRSTGR